MNYLDSQCTTNITCPYCGWEDRDSWEVQSDDGIMDCGRCDEQFKYSRNVSVDYSTSKLFENCDHPEASEYQGFFTCNDCDTFNKLDKKKEYAEILKRVGGGEKKII